MNAGSSFHYEAVNNGSGGADLMVVNGTLYLTDVALDLDRANLGLNTWQEGDKLTLISYTGSEITSGFNGFGDDTIYTGGIFGSNQWLFNYNDTAKGSNFASDAPAPGAGISYVTLTVVPEPRAALLGGLGLLALLRRRRLVQTKPAHVRGSFSFQRQIPPWWRVEWQDPTLPKLRSCHARVASGIQGSPLPRLPAFRAVRRISLNSEIGTTKCTKEHQK
jgi:hypothetical protein